MAVEMEQETPVRLQDVLALDEPAALRCCYRMAEDYRRALHAAVGLVAEQRAEIDKLKGWLRLAREDVRLARALVST